MLTRLRFKRNFKVFVRYVSEKPPEDDKQLLENKVKDDKAQNKNPDTASQTEKIQALLKSMMSAPKISENEYRAKFTTASEIPKKPKLVDDEIERKSEKIEHTLTKAAEEVAQAIGGDTKQTEAELLSKVLGKINQTSTNLSDLLVGMKVDRSRDRDEDVTRETRGQRVKQLVNKSQLERFSTRYSQRREMDIDRKVDKTSMTKPAVVDIFSGKPLGIFKTAEANYGTKLEMWERLNQRELNLATLQPPTNYFQKMIQWTEQGKVWKFPINNEQGLEEEENVHFSEHIFLDTHLEGWCPTCGPIRHFMELVCVGLSKNAFYTVQEKKDHIMWYKEYFESKKDILTEVGAWDVTPVNKESSV
ncbi:small ribosomal subunit protein mS31 [Battus philenor]|uniref:small ribosomal subunit protein mS31 n=1 Tax=Battus philenor TaxID=42288 RepID=UPI0035CFB566